MSSDSKGTQTTNAQRRQQGDRKNLFLALPHRILRIGYACTLVDARESRTHMQPLKVPMTSLVYNALALWLAGDRGGALFHSRTLRLYGGP